MQRLRLLYAHLEGMFIESNILCVPTLRDPLMTRRDGQAPAYRSDIPPSEH